MKQQYFTITQFGVDNLGKLLDKGRKIKVMARKSVSYDSEALYLGRANFNVLPGSRGVIYSFFESGQDSYINGLKWINKKGKAYLDVKKENRFDDIFVIDVTSRKRKKPEDLGQLDFLETLLS